MVLVVAGTIRRFLEHYGEEIEMVVFVTDDQEVNCFGWLGGALVINHYSLY